MSRRPNKGRYVEDIASSYDYDYDYDYYYDYSYFLLHEEKIVSKPKEIFYVLCPDKLF